MEEKKDLKRLFLGVYASQFQRNQMDNQKRGFPKRCQCGEPVVLKTSTTAKNPGRFFHGCLFGRDGNWYHTFKWTDTSMVEEIEDLIEKVENIDGAAMTLQKGVNACESQIDTLTMEMRVHLDVVEKEAREMKMQLRSLKNIVGFVMVMVLFFMCMY
ncbi:PREDICTED: uncharacterized protein At1g43920, Chloroplastic-like isoform X2 [Camelina sativa]|uniref:Uncharacterized protein At1g43920, Chloroplastic-like isoform X2 n=1 Tax=Camelina sativa TaxID=90675 RepID=A0ABM0V496_CAMSA|nr:PREDICTED: uncharacterized protein At1g43920, Chloroplastic-like isoform X2 [Camelina sativa]